MIIGVDEDVGFGLEEIEAAFEEPEVSLGDEREVVGGAVGIEGGIAPDVEQPVDRVATRPDVEQRRLRSLRMLRTPRLSGPRLM